MVPEARAIMMAGNVGAHSAGKALGAPLAPVLLHFGLFLNVAVAGGMDVIALAILVSMVKER